MSRPSAVARDRAAIARWLRWLDPAGVLAARAADVLAGVHVEPEVVDRIERYEASVASVTRAAELERQAAELREAARALLAPDLAEVDEPTGELPMPEGT